MSNDEPASHFTERLRPVLLLANFDLHGDQQARWHKDNIVQVFHLLSS